MIKRFGVLVLGMAIVCAGCGNPVSNNSVHTVESVSAVSLDLSDTYDKYQVTKLYEFDLNEVAAYFIDDYETYADLIKEEFWSNAHEYHLTFEELSYTWGESIGDDGTYSIWFDKRYTNDRQDIFEDEIEKSTGYVEQLAADFVLESIQTDGDAEVYLYRQQIDGNAIAEIAMGSQINVIVSRKGGFSVSIMNAIETVSACETLESTDFFTCDNVYKSAVSYLKGEASEYEIAEADVDLTIEKITVVYYMDGGILVPVYEVCVIENVCDLTYKTRYYMDVYSGIVRYVTYEGEAFWSHLI